jgi:hypothetical protein
MSGVVFSFAFNFGIHIFVLDEKTVLPDLVNQPHKVRLEDNFSAAHPDFSLELVKHCLFQSSEALFRRTKVIPDQL